METQWPCVAFSRLAVDSPEEVARFILWLCNADVNQAYGRTAEDLVRLPEPEELLEILWGGLAPRQRMARLLWQLLKHHDSPDYFRRWFTLNLPRLTEDAADCEKILGPIQECLCWVFEGFTQRREIDGFIGQGDWGEEWWLPSDQTAYVRDQLRRAHADLLQQPSNYEDSLRWAQLPYHELVSEDDDRVYVGARENCEPHVYVEDDRGERHPLSHTVFPFKETPGTGFEWGYHGHGPGELACSILADATGGDLKIAHELEARFVESVLSQKPREKDFRIPRYAVLDWLKQQGMKPEELREAGGRTRKLKARLEPQLAEHTTRLAQIRDMGGLLAQRFDIVPPDFESALYVDLMRMFERSGWVLRCSYCGLPMACDRSPRGNRQRARWLARRPVYHRECFRKQRLESKRAYWSRRTQDPTFREAERLRARRGRERYR